MIVFCYGTTAEAIKIAPVARRLDARGIPYRQWVTLQQASTVLDALPSLGLREPDEVLARGRGGRPLQGPVDVLVWLWQVLRWMLSRGAGARRGLGPTGIVLVHGDTMTSVVGAVIARVLRLRCGHIEAGLRSGDWRHPFPEELDRRIVGRLAHVHYAPSDAAAAVLASRPGLVHTRGNTVLDAVLDLARPRTTPDSDAPSDDLDLPGWTGPYGLVLLHRFELMQAGDLAARSLDVLCRRSPARLLLVADDHASHGMHDELAALDPGRVRVVGKQSHPVFSRLLAGASFVVTDSGGVQEEASLLGVPTLVHRRATERPDGLGRNVVLSGWDLEVLETFLADPGRHRYPPLQLDVSPSDIVVEDLISRGHAS